MIGPMPGTLISLFTAGVLARDGFDLFRQILDAFIEPVPVPSQIFDDAHHAWRQRARRPGTRQLGTQEAQSLPNSNTTFQQKGADLVDDAGALTH
jgi:hypothetical protein